MTDSPPDDDPMGARYRFQCYQDKNHESCHQLGAYLATYMKEGDKAKKVFKMNCDENNHVDSCFSVANMFFLGRGGEKNLDEACKYYEKGCRENHKKSCHTLGMLYLSESEKDSKQASLYFDKGCDNGCSRSCQQLSSMYITGNEGVPKNMKKGFRYAKKGCMLGNPYACSNLSIMYARGEGVAKNEGIAENIKKCVKELQKDAQSMKSSTQEEKSARLKEFRENISKLLPNAS
ncbi:hypothetical protein CAPTEDRAFT_179206 [Capitella teleta]|uniref:Beta-lactamase n=1 Tax=Capitella teleta TaxID=283909 RepID=R7U5P3_CAPTE|nr:hypothetical protein CAPTEDRAFT_179206 [Capitella teleta]|eukprot:ELT99011.1 hypothetical protein CAPTEDRAFT_179206 [Capitella teleta]